MARNTSLQTHGRVLIVQTPGACSHASLPYLSVHGYCPQSKAVHESFSHILCYHAATMLGTSALSAPKKRFADSAKAHTKRRAQDSSHCSLPRREKSSPARSDRHTASRSQRQGQACIQASANKNGSYARVLLHRWFLTSATRAACRRGRDRPLMPPGGPQLATTRPAAREARPPRCCLSGSTCAPRNGSPPLPPEPALHDCALVHFDKQMHCLLHLVLHTNAMLQPHACACRARATLD